MLPANLLAAELSEPEFVTLARRLTGKPLLSPAIALRALTCIKRDDPSFDGKAARLAAVIKDSDTANSANFRAFKDSHEPELSDAAMTIISALYLGYTGTPAMHSTTDDAQFVAYADALMYAPTADATVIPTYARGHTNYWSEPPATIATD